MTAQNQPRLSNTPYRHLQEVNFSMLTRVRRPAMHRRISRSGQFGDAIRTVKLAVMFS